MTGLGCSCGACKFLRRKCTSGCVFAPYFSYEQGSAHFAAVHKVYGASNVSRLLSHLPIHNRSDAAITITYEALARMHDPVYGCVAHIYALQQQVASLQEEIDIIGSLMANSTVGTAVNCGGFQASIMDSNNGIQNTTFQDDAAIRTQFYQNQLANLLSHHHQGNDMMMNQTLDSSKLDIEVPNNNNNNNALNGVLEEPLLFDDDDDDSNSNNPLDKFLSGIDQEGFLNHPWFKHNARIIN